MAMNQLMNYTHEVRTMKYISAKTWHDAKTAMRKRGEDTPPIDHVRTTWWSVTIILKEDNTMEAIQDRFLKLAEDPTFKVSYKEKEGKVHAAISWSKAKTGSWVLKQLDGTGAHIEPAIDAKTLTRYVDKS